MTNETALREDSSLMARLSHSIEALGPEGIGSNVQMSYEFACELLDALSTPPIAGQEVRADEAEHLPGCETPKCPIWICKCPRPSAPQSVGRTIRPLRWYKPTDHPCDREDALWMAMGYGGRYSIQEDGGHYIVFMADDEFAFEQGESVDACKAIAERHWQSQIAALAEPASPPPAGEQGAVAPVGIAHACANTVLTMATFYASEVPDGTKLYATPQSQDEGLREALAKIAAFQPKDDFSGSRNHYAKGWNAACAWASGIARAVLSTPATTTEGGRG